MSNLSLHGTAYARHVRIDRAMVYAVLAAGTAAGMMVSPRFWLMTPFVALGLVWASRRAAPAQLELPDDDPNQLPVRVEVAIHDAVAQLPSGDARRLLGDVVRQARPLFGARSSHFVKSKDEEARTHAANLVLAACDTALELSRLDGLLASDTRARAGRNAARDAELRERLTTARALFATRLSDAAAALGAMYASGVEHGTPSSDVVAELTSELSADAAARTRARAEMEELLA